MFKLPQPFTDMDLGAVVFLLLLNCVAYRPFDVLKLFLWQLRKTLYKVIFSEFAHV